MRYCDKNEVNVETRSASDAPLPSPVPRRIIGCPFYPRVAISRTVFLIQRLHFKKKFHLILFAMSCTLCFIFHTCSFSSLADTCTAAGYVTSPWPGSVYEGDFLMDFSLTPNESDAIIKVRDNILESIIVGLLVLCV